jgi:hypothetical protein
MSDGSGSIPAAWFPDPDGGPGQRYWDGTQWTEHYHPPREQPQQFAPPAAGTQVGAAPHNAAQQNAAPQKAAPQKAAPQNTPQPQQFAPPAAGAALQGVKPPKKNRTGLIISVIAGALVLAIGVPSFLIWGLPAIKANFGFNGQVYSSPDWDYDYTDEMLDLDPDHEFEYPANYDYDAVKSQHIAEGTDPESEIYDSTFAFEIFADAALTKSVSMTAGQFDNGGPVRIWSGDPGFGTPTEGESKTIQNNELGGFGLHPEYFLVRKVDANGVTLDKPVVTRFTVKQNMEAPVVTFSTPNADGNLTLEWNKIDGATNYFVVTSNVGFEGSTRYYKILGETSDTSWSSEALSVTTDVAPWLVYQNEDMQLFEGASSDVVELGWISAGSASGYDYGVIATDGTKFSPYISYDGAEVAAALPYETAFGANRDLKKWGKSGYIDGIENVQKTLAFTSLDGATRSTIAYIDPAETVTRYKDRWVVSLRGRGTNLGEWIPISRKSEPNIEKAIEEFNAAAEAAAPTTGMPTFDLLAAPVDEFATPVKEAPATDYPVYGSNDYTKFLAQHFIAQTAVIDVSDFVGKPGMPDTNDAALEARYQNPYAISIKALSISGSTVTVGYTYKKPEAEKIQRAISDKVDSVVSKVATGSMSDAKKIEALNNWLIDNAEYDYPAFKAMQEPFGAGSEFARAWTAEGVLVDGIGVCASYAYGFNALANAAGVETVVIIGDVKNGGAHAWNKVKIDGEWKAVDSTWNDSPDRNRFLMINDNEFTGSATRAETSEWMVDLDLAKYATK